MYTSTGDGEKMLAQGANGKTARKEKGRNSKKERNGAKMQKRKKKGGECSVHRRNHPVHRSNSQSRGYIDQVGVGRERKDKEKETGL